MAYRTEDGNMTRDDTTLRHVYTITTQQDATYESKKMVRFM
jgi:hypothetical protein